MIIDKEYPATHSMSTAWYCVDEEGNVAIFDIDDNGPVPEKEYCESDTETNEVFWDYFSQKESKNIRTINLTPEQIEPLLKPMKVEDVWEQSGCSGNWCNSSWMDNIVKIDMSKLDILIRALKKDKGYYFPPICLSKEQGLYYVDFFFNKKGVELLEENNVIMARYSVAKYNAPWNEDDKVACDAENRRFPFYIYRQDYRPEHEAAVLKNKPQHPMKLEQLPPDIQEKIFHIPVRFSEKDVIQIAEYVPVDVSSCVREIVHDRKIWRILKMENGTNGYYHTRTHTLMTEAEMKPFLESGEAAEYDYNNKEHNLIYKNDIGD